MDWQEISGNWVLIPPHPIGIVHFLGGAFVAAAPQVTYRWLLEQVAGKGYAVVATPFVNTLDHSAIAGNVLIGFNSAVDQLRSKGILRRRYLPVYGIGHSMGCKLHLLIGSLHSVDRAGNILISFNNYAARDAIPLVEQFNFASAFNVEFTPTPAETNKIITDNYSVRRNLLVKFSNDTIDQSTVLSELLQQKFPGMVAMQMLPGSHITPLGQDINWQAGKEFSPFDALGQWVKQEVLYKELNVLKREILRWLEPF